MKRKLCAFCGLLFMCFMAFGQDNNSVAAKTVNKLKAYNAEHIAEKAYLHFDKPYYAAGDTIYFKAYVTLGEKHLLSNLSGVLHVDLINTANKIDQSIKLQLIDGVAWGDFTLPDSLPKGNYRVRAYTQWMRNEGNDAFFEQSIPIGSLQNNRVPESAFFTQQGTNSKPDVQFFPEGGSLVTGVNSKIAFKVIGTNGLGITVKGEILDNENKVVTIFSSVHAGMGSFYLAPDVNRTYYAKIDYPDGTTDLVELPKAMDNGITLAVNNDSIPKATVKITASKLFFQQNQNKVYNLLIYSAGDITTVPCTLDSNEITLDVLKRRLHTGIATITLFSPENEPLCERLFFVQNYDRLTINLDSVKTVYAKREKVNISLEIKTRADSAASGHFSVAVTNESIVPINENAENTILTNLLLTSELKGYIEEPNYYIISPNATTNADLDLVMLTHGYRRLEWKRLLNDDYPPIAFQPEKGLEISGVAKNTFGKPLSNGTVSLIKLYGPVTTQQTDEKGNFHFSNLLFTDSAKFILQAVNAKGKNTTTIIYNKEKRGPVVVDKTNFQYDLTSQPGVIYLKNTNERYAEAVKYGTARGILLKEVKIKENKKHIIDDTYRSSSLFGPGHADQVIRRSEFKGGGLFSDQFNGVLRGVTFSGPFGRKRAILTGASSMGLSSTSPMLLVIDGTISNVPIDAVNVNDIETIEVLKGANATVYGFNSGGGVLVITTRQGGEDLADIQAVGILPITVNGFYKSREFYSPKYEHPNDNLNRRDLRSTIYWNPDITTNKDGNAWFEYYNADGAGTYKVVVEGIDEKGNLGRQVYRYKVE